MRISSLVSFSRHTELTSYFSLTFLLVFLPLTILIFSIFPDKFKKYVLLAVSYLFFFAISGKLVTYLFLSTMSIHYFGLWMDRIYKERDAATKGLPREERKALKAEYLAKARHVIQFAVFLHIGMLLVLKYSEFFGSNVNKIFNAMNLKAHIYVPHYIMPIGISFFTLQAVSYLFDVYRETIKADDNLVKLGLFMAFFPQIVEGPICRYGQTADQLWNVKKIKYEDLTFGYQRIIYGLMKKVVIADRLNPFIENIFTSYSNYEGGVIALGAIAYTLQLYCDFSGTMDAVIGTAQIFGIKLPENFERPFFSRTISEFWKRWHISLGAWFKDYIFYPVTMSKSMKNLTSSARKKVGNHFGPLVAGSIALFFVWFSNGLWHGAAWSYIFFGMYHFTFILIGSLIAPAVKTVNSKLKINSEGFAYKLMQMLRTTILVIIGELFFRAYGLKAGLNMFTKMITNFSFKSLNDELLLSLGIDILDVGICILTVIIIFIISVLNEKGIIVRDRLKNSSTVFRWIVLYALILYIVIFGAYGHGYVPVDPIYANF